MSFLCLFCVSNSGKVKPENSEPEINACLDSSIMSSEKSSSFSALISLSADPQDYQFVKQLGCGFGDLTSIWIACFKNCPKNIVVKKTCLDIPDSEKIDLMRHEVHVSRILVHPNILPCLGAFVCGKELWTVSPFMGFGSCNMIIEAGFPDGLPEAAIAYILRDVLRALDNIHRMGFIHRAVKGSHILVSETGAVRLSGLRESHCLSPNGYNHLFAYDFPLHAATTLPWLAPEVLEQNLLGYDYRSDIYSVGITAVELAYGIVPYDNLSPSQVLLAKLQEGSTTLESFPDTTLSKLSPGRTSCSATDISDSGLGGSLNVRTLGQREKVKNKTFSTAFHQFVNQCLQKEPGFRPSASGLLTHSFFKHAKKKIKETLPELLIPVFPATLDANEPEVSTTITAMTDSLDKLTLESWNF